MVKLSGNFFSEKVRYAWNPSFYSASMSREALIGISSVLTWPMTVTHRNLEMSHSWKKDVCASLCAFPTSQCRTVP